MKNKVIIAGLTCFLATLLVNSAHCAGNDIKARMIARLPAIIALKEKGLIVTDGTAIKAESGRKQLKMWSSRHYHHESVTDEERIQHMAEERAGI